MPSVLGDVYSFMAGVRECIVSFGCTDEFKVEYSQRVLALGRKILEERGISEPDGLEALQPNDELGVLSRQMFESLRSWCSTQNVPVGS